MCGFVGVIGDTNISLDASIKVIKHRGPDQTAIKKERNLILGFNRLAIIDLETSSMQPFENDDCIVYLNGEIYNYLELIKDFNYKPKTNSDVEIIPFLYKKLGLEFLNLINGMFAMVLIDKRNGKTFLIKDRFGKKPLYFIKKNNKIYFASEIKAIKKLINLEVSQENLHINMACHLLPPPLSLYKNVNSVMPASFLEINHESFIREKRWYFPKFSNINKFCEDDFINLFQDSIKIRTRSDVPLSIYLSGGLDSMLITEFVRKNKKDIAPLTANIQDKGKWDNNNTDVINQTKYCKQFNLENHCTFVNYEYWNKNILEIINNYEEIFVDSGNLIFYALGKLAKENNFKVVLAGNGGDELFGGYPWQKKLNSLKTFINKKSIILNNFEKISSSFLSYFKRTAFRDRTIRLLQILLRPELYFYTSLSSTFIHNLLLESKSINKLRNLSKECLNNIYFDSEDWGNKINLMNFSTVIPSQNFKADMGSMFSSVENRAPFLDYRIFEYMFSISHSLKVEKGHKSLLREVSRKYLPEYIVNAKKSGPTMPLNVWFSGEKLEDVKNFVVSNRNLCGDIMGGRFADEWCKKDCYGLNLENKLGLFSLISLIVWLKLNVENCQLKQTTTFEEFINF